MSNTIGNVATVATMNIQSMDLETAMLTVQTNRANLLETQLKDQITAVQAKNDQIAKLNQLLGVMNKAAAGVSGSATASTAVSMPAATLTELKAAATEAGITLSTELNGNTANKGQLDGAIQQLKSQIDAASNSQQMDMLRLQSLSNKRNEAFETMTNFIKKMQDSRNSIIGNMR